MACALRDVWEAAYFFIGTGFFSLPLRGSKRKKPCLHGRALERRGACRRAICGMELACESMATADCVST